MLDDLDDLRVRVTSKAHSSEICIRDVASVARHLGGEANGGIGLGVGRGAVPVGCNLGIIKLRQIFAEVGVSRQAIIAAIHLCHGQRDPFAGGCWKSAFAQRPREAEITFKGLRARRHKAKQVWGRPKLLHHGVQQGLRGGRRIGDGLGLGNTGHGQLLRLGWPLSSAGFRTIDVAKNCSIRDFLNVSFRFMEHRMDRFEAMRTLVAAVDGGSLSAASRTLGVPLPTISRRVSDLEAHLRAQLVVRTSRKLLLTEAGRAYVATARRILFDMDEAERSAAGEYLVPRGDLLITAPVMFGRLHVQPVVLNFLATYPEINLRLELADYVADLVENQIDMAVRIGSLPDSSLIATALGSVGWVTCASPAYLAQHGTPQILDDLTTHRCIAFERLSASDTWMFQDGSDEATLKIRPQFAVNSAIAVLDAALAGAGIARLLSYQVADAISAGRLVRVLADFQPKRLPVHLMHRGQAILPLKVRAFLDFALPRLKARLAGVEV